MKDIARYIDHTLLKSNVTVQAINQLCTDAMQYNFAAVCVNPCHVPLCAELLQGSGIKVCTVVGFPLGAAKSEVKAYESQVAVRDGAVEVDMVMNIGEMLSGNQQNVERDITAVVTAVAGEAIVKVILETEFLTRPQISAACKIAKEAGAHFVKTSTGFFGPGATVENVRLMREAVGPRFGVKAAGGIRDIATALSMLDAGANRLGTSSGVAIIEEQRTL